MSDHPLPESIPISSLNALEYCPRRFYYQFVQGDTPVNAYLLEGTLAHKRVHQATTRTVGEGEIQTTHLYLFSEKLHISGFADVTEEQDGLLIPVEYKHGAQGKHGGGWLNDAVQLCAQALCLEERMEGDARIPHGYIFYIASRRRVRVQFDDELRRHTLVAIERAFQVAMLETPPPPLSGADTVRCPACSLLALCMPDEVTLLQSGKGGVHVNVIPQ